MFVLVYRLWNLTGVAHTFVKQNEKKEDHRYNLFEQNQSRRLPRKHLSYLLTATFLNGSQY